MKIKMSLFKDKKGQSLIEFALVLPILLLVLLGIIEFGRIIMAVNVLNQAAREGARVGAVTPESADSSFYYKIQDRVQEFIDAANLKGTPTVTIIPPDADRKITVTINYAFPFATKFFRLFLPQTVNLRGSCVMYYEG
jgi:Flp pilus assembly protein TadG